MKQKILVPLLVIMIHLGAVAEPIEEGWWMQTASTAGEGVNVAMEVTAMTPHIISLKSNNGWVGYAWYSEETQQYTGFFELIKPSMDPNDWTGEVFQIVLTYDGLTLTMRAHSTYREFHATFWMKDH